MILTRVIIDQRIYFSVEYSSALIEDNPFPAFHDVDPRIEPCDSFIRYGDVPTTGNSMNHRTGDVLAGLSVYRCARIVGDNERGEYLPILPNNDAIGSFAGGLKDRPRFLVPGEEVGTGPDGEPLIRCEGKAVPCLPARRYTITEIVERREDRGGEG